MGPSALISLTGAVWGWMQPSAQQSAPQEAPPQSGGFWDFLTDTVDTVKGFATRSWKLVRAPSDQVDDLEQGGKENCGALSVIKVMLDKWGPHGVARTETLPDGSVRVTMRDGCEVTLTPEELEQARAASGIADGDPEAIEAAVLLIGAAAKRYAAEKGVSYEEGLTFINDPHWPDEVARYFGVKATAVHPETLDGKAMAIVANGTHAAIVVKDGNGVYYQDDHGALAIDPDTGDVYTYDGRVISNDESTGEASHAWVIEDVEATSEPEADSVSWGYIGDLVKGWFRKGRPGEGADPGYGGEPAAPEAIMGSEAYKTAMADANEAQGGGGQEASAATAQADALASLESEVSQSYEGAASCEQAAVETGQQTAEVDGSLQEEARLSQAQDYRFEQQLRSVQQQLTGCQSQLVEIHGRIISLRRTLTDVESERGRLVGQDYLMHYEEIDRLDGIAGQVRGSISGQEKAARDLQMQIERLHRQAEDTYRERAEAGEQSDDRREALVEQRSRLEVRSGLLEVQGGRQRQQAEEHAERVGFWTQLSDPSALSEVAEHAADRATELRERDQEAARIIRTNADFLGGYGELQRARGGVSETTAERSLSRLQGALGWVDPARRTPKAS